MLRFRFHKLVVAAIVAFGVLTQAQESTDSLSRFSRSQAGKDFEILLKAESLQYPTEVSNDPRLNQSNMLEASFRGSWETPWVTSGIDVGAGKAVNLNYDYFALHEIYSEWKSSSGVLSVGVGRKLQFWNQADRDWNLGLWEPLFNHDGLRLRQQGLTGLFFGLETPNVQVMAFASPIFVPTMTPDIAENDGAITSESRWFRSLPSSQSIIGKETQLSYDLQIPAVAELINNPGYGARVRVGAVNAGPWASLAYARKAVNAMSYRYDASLLTQASFLAPDAKAEIELNPVTHRHEIVSLDFGYRKEVTAVGVSLVADRPEIKSVANRLNSKGFETDYIQQQIRPVTLATFSLTSVLTALPKRIEWRLDYLKASTENSVDVDARGNEQSQLVPDRLQYTNAASISGTMPLSQKVRTTLRYLREFDQLGSLVSLNLDYLASRNWLLNFGVDSLGVDDPEAQANDTRFLNRYRQNDRVFGGLTYVY